MFVCVMDGEGRGVILQRVAEVAMFTLLAPRTHMGFLKEQMMKHQNAALESGERG